MAISAQVIKSQNALYLKGFPERLPFQTKKPPASGPRCMPLQVKDSVSAKENTAYVQELALQNMGLCTNTLKTLQNNPKKLLKFVRNTSTTRALLARAAPIAAKHLTPEQFQFFQDNNLEAIRFINTLIEQKTKHTSKIPGMPGFYFYYINGSPEIFMNLKGTKTLGVGNFGKVRKALWLTAPETNQILVAKKVLLDANDQEGLQNLGQETEILADLTDRTGIISMLCSDNFNGKRAMFLPYYQWNLSEYYLQGHSLTQKELLSVTSQLLRGLAKIEKKGVHGDIANRNILLRRDPKGNLEAVIADFGRFQAHGAKAGGFPPSETTPPEYAANGTTFSKQDIWALGLLLYQKISLVRLPVWDLPSENRQLFLSGLEPGWIAGYPHLPNTPPFFSLLLKDMLDPRPEHRPTALEACRHFATGYAQWQNASVTQPSVQSSPRKRKRKE